jgi:dTDP-glucose pyrophosphorylase
MRNVAGFRDATHHGDRREASETEIALRGDRHYMFDGSVFDKVRTLVPSGRGELEITNVNNAYIREGTMTFPRLEGWWTGCGTFESLLRAATGTVQGFCAVLERLFVIIRTRECAWLRDMSEMWVFDRVTTSGYL